MSHRNVTDRVRVTGFNSYTDFPPQTLVEALYLRVRLRDYLLMKPLLSPLEDSNSLQTLGRASLQIVHDLKNPVNSMDLHAQVLLRMRDLPEHAKESVTQIRVGAC